MSEQQFELSFPRSRNTNSREGIELFVESDKDKRSVQFEYNSSPIGPYMGPYDQSDCIPLNAQLSDSNLNFKQYTQFNHAHDVLCKLLRVVTETETESD